MPFKGFDKDLKCKSFQFQMGVIHAKNEKENPKLCSMDGFHYCNTLQECFHHYDNDGENRFCEVEICGNFTYSRDKGITTSIKLIKEIDKDELYKIAVNENLFISKLKSLVSRYPHLIIGGSVSLFLQGAKLNRFRNEVVDFDIISPYYTLIENSDGTPVRQEKAERSGNDFEDAFYYDGVKVDMRIDPKEKYKIVEYDGVKFKVGLIHNIVEAKCRYAKQGNQKHIDDLQELITGFSKNNSNDIPF